MDSIQEEIFNTPDSKRKQVVAALSLEMSNEGDIPNLFLNSNLPDPKPSIDESTGATKKEKQTKKKTQAVSDESEGYTGSTVTATSKSSKKSNNSNDDPQLQVLNYMKQMNRPYNSTAIFENLHRAISHVAVKNALEGLVLKGELCGSDSTNKIFWINQANVPLPDPDLLKTLDNDMEKISENIETRLQPDLLIIEREVFFLEKQPRDDEIESVLESKKREIIQLEQEISKLEESARAAIGDSEKISEGLMVSPEQVRAELNFYKVSALQYVNY